MHCIYSVSVKATNKEHWQAKIMDIRVKMDKRHVCEINQISISYINIICPFMYFILAE